MRRHEYVILIFDFVQNIFWPLENKKETNNESNVD